MPAPLPFHLHAVNALKGRLCANWHVLPSQLCSRQPPGHRGRHPGQPSEQGLRCGELTNGPCCLPWYSFRRRRCRLHELVPACSPGHGAHKQALFTRPNKLQLNALGGVAFAYSFRWDPPAHWLKSICAADECIAAQAADTLACCVLANAVPPPVLRLPAVQPDPAGDSRHHAAVSRVMGNNWVCRGSSQGVQREGRGQLVTAAQSVG